MPSSCITSLKENSNELFLTVTSILMKLLDNVILHPDEPKYRKIRLNNATISKYVLPAIGGMECLFEMGFVEGDDSLILPQNVNLNKLKLFRQDVINIREQVINTKTAKCTPPTMASSTTQSSTEEPSKSNQSGGAIKKEIPQECNTGARKKSPPKFIKDELEHYSNKVLQYENKELQAKARSFIPLSKLHSNIEKQMRAIQDASIKNRTDFSEASVHEVIFLKELMKWFKFDFFKWVNCPECPDCNSETVFRGDSANSEELVHADSVEVWFCTACKKKVMFPRLNDASLLLESRRGRCGEWAQCFTLFCRAFGWDARLIIDRTDHSWTEVYSKFQNKWMHIDPCECVIDRPLLYEKGWKKKLNYIFGYACDGVQDVTWRYSSDHKSIMKRRTLYSESELKEKILELNEKRKRGLSAARVKYLLKREVTELAEFLTPAQDNSEETLGGRTSGSLTWRLARGEISSKDVKELFVWKPNPEEISEKKINLRYCPTSDNYYKGDKKELNGWAKGTYKVSNIFRKEELDWKMVYLCRTENDINGTIEWRFDFLDSGLCVDNISGIFSVSTYENASVTVILCGTENCIKVNTGENGFQTDALKGETELQLKAELTGGKGDVAWQHAQLFRKPLSASTPPTPFPFDITITLSKK